MDRLLPFVMAGDPAADALAGLLRAAKAAGISTIEVGVPHSDPIADGPALQAAAQRAIERGIAAESVLRQLAAITDSPDVVLFTYLNPLLQIGSDRLIELLKKTPVRSLLIVDLPFGEEPEFETTLRIAGYPIVPLLSPTTSVERAQQLLAERPDPGTTAPFAQRFAYVVARLGITGEGTHDFAPIAERVAALRTITDRPLAVGFGLSEPQALERIRAMGATPVVGTALVQELANGMPAEQAFLARV
ncbi:tryptophan synthase subunit alpha [Solilutibacter silvestris]|uniref:tryptophan synthase n=1 Tax=Solilutibacter silvestris TaxID=1645665 RepID=A0A2K1PXE6_9GAMM|nr:tryptophan synthase subunit alpha [Lysobacter silvestris]PNS07460.1 trpA: tryptophan synthase, alpha subunit [Lysobacter silvestris]